jgi:hypothetical protein
MSENAELKRTIEAMKKDQTRFKMLLVRYEDLVSKHVFHAVWGSAASCRFGIMWKPEFGTHTCTDVGSMRLRQSVRSSVVRPSS